MWHIIVINADDVAISMVTERVNWMGPQWFHYKDVLSSLVWCIANIEAGSQQQALFANVESEQNAENSTAQQHDVMSKPGATCETDAIRTDLKQTNVKWRPEKHTPWFWILIEMALHWRSNPDVQPLGHVVLIRVPCSNVLCELAYWLGSSLMTHVLHQCTSLALWLTIS